jgi:hypothetical protein
MTFEKEIGFCTHRPLPRKFIQWKAGGGRMGEAVAAPFNKGGKTTLVEGDAKRDVGMDMDMVLVIIVKCRQRGGRDTDSIDTACEHWEKGVGETGGSCGWGCAVGG